MDILVEQGSVTEIQTPLLAVNLFEGVRTPGGATGAVDKALGGLLSQLIAEGDVKGKLDEITVIHTLGKLPAARVAVVGLGPQEKFNLEAVRRASGTVLKRARHLGIKGYSSVVHGAGAGGLDIAACSQAMAEGALLAGYGYKQFKTGEKPAAVDRLTLVEMDRAKILQIQEGVRRGRIFAEATATARDVAAGPPNVVNPQVLAEKAQELSARYGLDCQVLAPREMEQMGMGAILAVGRGSVHPPRMVLMKYQGDPGNSRLLGVIGKGITFDSGGISIKPSENMDRMRYDKSGAADVLGVMQGVAELKPKANVLGILAAAENLPDGNAFRPGDILTASNGKTIEVISTDAEGRLVLADALAYAVKQGVQAVVDLATLTGGVGTALGTGGAGIMGNDDALIQQLREAGERAGERLWQLPIWEEYLWEQVRSEFADIKNTGGRMASPAAGAIFLQQFVGNTPWAHLDIAAVAWVDSDHPAVPKAYVPKGPTGFGTRLLLEFIEQWAKG